MTIEIIKDEPQMFEARYVGFTWTELHGILGKARTMLHNRARILSRTQPVVKISAMARDIMNRVEGVASTASMQPDLRLSLCWWTDVHRQKHMRIVVQLRKVDRDPSIVGSIVSFGSDIFMKPGFEGVYYEPYTIGANRAWNMDLEIKKRYSFVASGNTGRILNWDNEGMVMEYPPADGFGFRPPSYLYLVVLPVTWLSSQPLPREQVLSYKDSRAGLMRYARALWLESCGIVAIARGDNHSAASFAIERAALLSRRDGAGHDQ
jgi:hypothetical protein